MSLTKTTSLGTITINTAVISREILFATAKVNEKLFLASEKCKVLGSPKKVGSGELAANIKVEQTKEEFKLTFYIVMNFGSSIKSTTETVLDYLEESFKAMFPKQNGKIVLKIVGVKSKNVAPRDIEVIREYEASRQD